MSRLRTVVSWIGQTAGGIAIVALCVTLLVGGGFYLLSDTTPAIGVVEILLPTVLVGGGFLVWVISKLALRYLGEGDKFEAVDQPGPPVEHTEQVSETERSLDQFTRANLYLAVVFGCLLVLSVASANIQSVLQGTPLAVLGGFLVFTAQITGGSLVHAANLFVFGGAWFSLRRYAAREGWLLGTIGWGLISISGVGLLSRSLGAIAIVVGGVKVLSVGYRALGSTTWRFLDDYLAKVRDDIPGHSGTQPAGANGRTPMETVTGGSTTGQVAATRAALSNREIRGPNDLWALLDVDLVFVHPREAGDPRLTYWSLLSYGLGTLTLLSTLLVGVQVWGLPSLGLWGLPIGLLYLAHGFGLPQGSPVIHVGGLAFYGLTFLLSVITVSPLAIVGAGAGVYLGWAATRDLRSPEDVLDEFAADGDGAQSTGLLGRLRNGGIVAAVVLGGTLGLVGAAAFAWISLETRTVYGLLLLVPPLAAGYGVAIGIGEAGERLKGFLAAGVATVSVLFAFRLLTTMMPRGYELQPEPLLAVGPLLGIYGAYKVAVTTHSASGGESGPSASTTDGPTATSESDGT